MALNTDPYATTLGSAINGLARIAERDTLPDWAEAELRAIDSLVWSLIDAVELKDDEDDN